MHYVYLQLYTNVIVIWIPKYLKRYNFNISYEMGDSENKTVDDYVDNFFLFLIIILPALNPTNSFIPYNSYSLNFYENDKHHDISMLSLTKLAFNWHIMFIMKTQIYDGERAATPGNTLPSKSSRLAPPPVLT